MPTSAIDGNTNAADAITKDNKDNAFTMQSTTGVDGSTESTEVESNVLTKETTPISANNDQPIAKEATSTGSKDTKHSQDFALQLSIVLPMPNVEPFLGSLENYAVWDTRMFLLAGLYVIVRVFYLLLTWVRSGRV